MKKNKKKKSCLGSTHTSQIGIIWNENQLSSPTSFIRMHGIPVARNQSHTGFTKTGQCDLAVWKSSIWLIPPRGVASVALPHVKPVHVFITVTPLIYDSANALQAVHAALRWAINHHWGLTWAGRGESAYRVLGHCLETIAEIKTS